MSGLPVCWRIGHVNANIAFSLVTSIHQSEFAWVAYKHNWEFPINKKITLIRWHAIVSWDVNLCTQPLINN